MRGSFTLIAAISLLSACRCRQAWELGHLPVAAPDEQYTIPGVGLGAEVYVWRCVAGQHLVVAKSHDEWVCSDAKIERVACGATTKIEERAKERGKEPVLKAWPGTTPTPPAGSAP